MIELMPKDKFEKCGCNWGNSYFGFCSDIISFYFREKVTGIIYPVCQNHVGHYVEDIKQPYKSKNYQKLTIAEANLIKVLL